MGVFDYKNLEGNECEFGSCNNDAWTLVTYRSMSKANDWSTKHFCHKHYCQKFIGNWPNHPEKMYQIDSHNSYIDLQNKEKPE